MQTVRAAQAFSTSQLYPVLGAVASIIAIGGLVSAWRPRTQKDLEVVRYIRFRTNEIIEEKEHKLYWGRLFPSKINLPKVARGCEYRVQYKPITSFKQDLSRDAFEVHDKGKKRQVKLINREIFKIDEAEFVYVETRTPLDDKSYRSKVTLVPVTGGTKIENRNSEEVKDYPCILPRREVMKNLGLLSTYASDIDTQSRVLDDKPLQDNEVIVYIRSIGPMQGELPGTIVLPVVIPS
jgi:hypothetical protein